MDQAGHVWPDMVRMRVQLLSTLKENEAYGPPVSEGEIDSVVQLFLYGNAGFMKSSLHSVPKKWHIYIIFFFVDIISSEMIRTDNVQGQISEHIFKVKWKLLCLLSFKYSSNARNLLEDLKIGNISQL